MHLIFNFSWSCQKFKSIGCHKLCWSWIWDIWRDLYKSEEKAWCYWRQKRTTTTENLDYEGLITETFVCQWIFWYISWDYYKHDVCEVKERLFYAIFVKLKLKIECSRQAKPNGRRQQDTLLFLFELDTNVCCFIKSFLAWLIWSFWCSSTSRGPQNPND